MNKKIVLAVTAGLLALPVSLFAVEAPTRAPNGPVMQTQPVAPGQAAGAVDKRDALTPKAQEYSGAPVDAKAAQQGAPSKTSPQSMPPQKEVPCSRPVKDGVCGDNASGGQPGQSTSPTGSAPRPATGMTQAPAAPTSSAPTPRTR